MLSFGNGSCSVFVLGFSTGHVGTTTLSNQHSYVDGSSPLSSYHFIFENVKLRVTMNTTFLDEEKYAKKYLKSLVIPGEHQKCVDLSHYWMSFGRGLIKLLRENEVEVRVVRIRRDACEVAKSFAESRRGARNAKCLANVGACALDVPDLALPVDKKGWMAWSPFQRALWMSDETEKRWKTIYEPMLELNHVLEVEWSKSDERFDDPLLAALIPISNYLGLGVNEDVPRTKEHVNETVSSLERRGEWTSEETKQILQYRQDLRARFDNVDHLPSSRAKCV